MLSDKICTVLAAMDITISDVARAGGCTPFNLNRVKNGVRTPPAASPTIRALTDGLMTIAEQRHMAGELRRLCGAEIKDSDEELRAKLIRWLFEEEPPYVRTYRKHEHGALPDDRQEPAPTSVFATRFDKLMLASGLSNRRLGHEAGLDPSYISRLRRGERIPRFQSPYLAPLCRAIRDRMTEDGKLPKLSEMTSITREALTGEDGEDELRIWLFGYGSVTGQMAADELMGTIGSIDELIRKARERIPEKIDLKEIAVSVKSESGGEPVGGEERYVGVDGLRTAVVRFLTEMIECGDDELLLYSDQPMEWMGGEYRHVLAALMSELVRRGVKIRIIHTVSRSLPELISAIEWWLPLYLSGMIKSYYCTVSVGKRFSHTLFIRRGAACIAGTSAAGLEERTIYSYSQEPAVTDMAEEAFGFLLQESLPLVELTECSVDASEEEGYIRTGKVMVKADRERVIIRRDEPPYLMFSFTHPMIVSAFRAYMNSQ